MTREEAIASIKQASYLEDGWELTQDSALDTVEAIYLSISKQISTLEQQVAYWKLSFHKQCEAGRSK